MERQIIDKANEIIKLIEDNKKAVSELEKYAEIGKAFIADAIEYRSADGKIHVPEPVNFEAWEIRLMIHNKKQRIAALEKQLEQL